jgi:hypothetical protein
MEKVGQSNVGPVTGALADSVTLEHQELPVAGRQAGFSRQLRSDRGSYPDASPPPTETDVPARCPRRLLASSEEALGRGRGELNARQRA